MYEDNKLNPRIVTCDCPGCGKRIVFSANGGSKNDPVHIACPSCRSNFVFLNNGLYPYAGGRSASSKRTGKESSRPKPVRSPHRKKSGLIGLSIALGIAAVIGLVIFLWANRHVHTWAAATCDVPKTCTVCGKTEGLPKGHSWRPATCTAPETCSVCGATQGSPIAHSWSAATCAAPKTCSVCGKTDGKPVDHNWSTETLTSPSTCSFCGEMRPMSTPDSGQVYLGADLDRPSEITINTSSESVYVKLKDTSGKDVFAFFACADQTTTVSVPSGMYRAYFAHGKDWYGPEYCFGDSTIYSKDSDLLDLNNYTYTYTMYSVIDGNFEETPVSKDEFD